MEVDWSHRAGYMQQRHGVTVEQVSEALGDLRAIVVEVILVHREDRPGAWWGANGWVANSTDQRTYTEQNAEMESGDE